MKRLWIILLLLCVLLTGCAQTAISCGVDREMNAFLTLEHTAQWDDANETMAGEIMTGMELLAAHYRNKLGFTVEETYTETGCILRATMTRKAESYDEAFRELETMLTDEAITPFVQVDSQQTKDGDVSGYELAVTLDAGNVLSSLGLENLPGDMQMYLRDAIANSSATVSLTLPAAEVLNGAETATLEDSMASITAEADLQGQTTLELSTMAIIQNGNLCSDAGAILTDSIHTLERERQFLRIILLAAVAGSAVLLGVLLYLRAHGKKHPPMVVIPTPATQPAEPDSEPVEPDSEPAEPADAPAEHCDTHDTPPQEPEAPAQEDRAPTE